MAAKKKPETPIQETVAKVVDKVKKGRKNATAAKPAKKATAKGAKAAQVTEKQATKAATPVACKEQDKQDAGKPSPKRDSKGKFVKGQSGNPKGRMAGQANQALLEIRAMAKEDALPKLREAIKKGEKWAILAALEYGLPKIKPLSVDPEQVSAKAKELLQDYLDGKRTLKDTALLMDMNGVALPPTIEILLRKEEPLPDDPTGGQYSTMSSEEMERLVAERKAKAKAQEEGVAARREAISELYKSMEGKDSFAPGATPTSHDDGEEGV